MTDAAPTSVTLRLAKPEDCLLYWEWANCPDVRSMAFHSTSIPWEAHVKWFTSRLNSAKSFLFVMEDKSQIPVGQVRFDECEEGVFEIDLSVASNRRGHGLGKELLSLGESMLRRCKDIRTLRASVLSTNAASLALFLAAGYEVSGRIQGHKGKPAMALQKNI